MLLSRNSQYVYLSFPWGESCPPYGGGEPIKLLPGKRMCEGDSCNTLTFVASNHIGTHFDFPNHFSVDGKHVCDYPAEFFLFSNVQMVALPGMKPGDFVTPDRLHRFIDVSNSSTDLVLIKTGSGQWRNSVDYWQNGIGFHAEIAEMLRECFPKLRAVGLDTISISSMADREEGRKAHRSFLCHHKPILIIEDMDLSAIDSDARIASVAALPLRIEAGDGAPCTIIAALNS